ncbi:OprO/OprP family phosphate-selective porin [Hydrocarboniphaga sp.]|uniref:OprO/OprP family phosphate-selective porin n=1 Tax=Hydrocarboniphaga sp. TaxID=2033016 RepID=UPI003D096CEE
MNSFIKYGALAAFIGGSIGAAQADTAETKGGFKIKTDDGRFEMSIGGRIMFDLYTLSEDDDALAFDPAGSGRNAKFGSNTAANDERSSTYFRRLYLTLKGKAYGWNYKFEPDFAGNSTNNTSGSRDIAFQDVYISHAFGPGGEIIIGQIKPFRGMEELTSSNDITLMERPFASAAGIFNGGSSREFQQGVFYKADISDFLFGAGFFDLRRDNTRPTEGLGYNARAVYAPFRNDGQVLHVAVSYTDENPQTNGNDGTVDGVGSAFGYAGRRGPSVGAFTTTGGEHATTIGGELAGSFGPATLQAEYMLQKLDQSVGSSQDVVAWYAQASYFVTGEAKPYKKGEGAFGQPKAKNDFGAIELAVRYDSGENKDSNAACNVTIPAVAASGTTAALPAITVLATECSATALTLGANWYVNPNVRFMLNYIMGENDRGFAKDKPEAITARAQFAF